MKRVALIVTMVAMAAALGLATFAFAQGERPGEPGAFGFRPMCGRMHRGGFRGMARLNLTAAQKTQAQAIRAQTRKDIEAVITQEQRAQMEQAREQRFNEFMQKLGLTPEQQTKITALKDGAKAQLKQLRDGATLTPEARYAKVREIIRGALQAGQADIDPGPAAAGPPGLPPDAR